MSSPQSSLDAILLAFPLVGVLFAGFFRLDETLGKPKRSVPPGRPLSHVSEEGDLVCIEPDGRYSLGVAGGKRNGLGVRIPGHLPRRNRVMAVRHVFVDWRAGDGQE